MSPNSAAGEIYFSYFWKQKHKHQFNWEQKRTYTRLIFEIT